MEDIDGKRVTVNETTVYGRLLAEDGPSTIVYTISKNRMHVAVDGKTIIDFRGDSSRLSLNPAWAVPNERALFVGAYDCSYRIERLELSRPRWPEDAASPD